MKIYFEDGELRHYTQIPFNVDLAIQANLGVNQNLDMLEWYLANKPNITVYTNSIFAFDNRYAWNEELNAPEIYIRAGERMEFTRIDKLTNRELRQGHNLAKMYVSGEFDNCVAGKLNRIKE